MSKLKIERFEFSRRKANSQIAGYRTSAFNLSALFKHSDSTK